MDFYIAQWWEYSRREFVDGLPACEPRLFSTRLFALQGVLESYALPRVLDVADMAENVLEELNDGLDHAERIRDLDDLIGIDDEDHIEKALDSIFGLLDDELVNAGYSITVACPDGLVRHLERADVIYIDDMLVDNYGIHADCEDLFLDARYMDDEGLLYEWFFSPEQIEGAVYTGEGVWEIEDGVNNPPILIKPCVLSCC